MVEWEIYSENNPLEWDNSLLKGEDSNVFQTFGWGEYKRFSGWDPHRFIVRNKNGSIVAMAQILIKSLPGGVKMGWSPGGPVFGFSQFQAKDFDKQFTVLMEKIKSQYGKVFIRFHSHLPNDFEQAYSFNQSFVKPFFKLNSGYTINFDVTLPTDILLKNMTSKHRYYLKKSLENDFQWKNGNSELFVKELLGLHNEMVSNKNMASLKASMEDTKNLCVALGENATIFTGYINDEPVTSCLILTFGKKAFYMMAAAGNRGRDFSASYAMVFKLLEHLKEKGIAKLDFGGIDPRTPSARGVNHFKRGFGGNIVEYLGEWEWASTEWLRWGINLAIWRKGGRL